MIENETDEAIKSDDFMTIERPVLEELVQKDSLNVKEVELFRAVDCWAGRECKRQGPIAGGSVKRKILVEKIIKGIRFPVMEEKEFDSVLVCGILTQKETCDLVTFFDSVPNTSLDSDFCKVKRKVSPLIPSFQISIVGVSWKLGTFFRILRYDSTLLRQRHKSVHSSSFW